MAGKIWLNGGKIVTLHPKFSGEQMLKNIYSTELQLINNKNLFINV